MTAAQARNESILAAEKLQWRKAAKYLRFAAMKYPTKTGELAIREIAWMRRASKDLIDYAKYEESEYCQTIRRNE